MCNTTDKTKEFFIFSYFGILPEAIFNTKEKLMKEYNENYYLYVTSKCAYRAYLDLNRTLTVNKKVSDKERKVIVYNICNTLICNIKDKLFNSTDFDTQHNDICTNLKNYINDKTTCKLLSTDSEDFTYGQAQKWLNMTLKYMWLLGLLDGKIKTEFLHVPVDSYIIKEVWKNNKIELPITKTRQDGSRGAYSSEKVVSWSNWGYDEYKKFQNSLKDSLKDEIRIKWEHYAWIENAE